MPLPGLGAGPSGLGRIGGLKGAKAPSQARVRTTQLSGREYACECITKQQNFRFLKKCFPQSSLELLARHSCPYGPLWRERARNGSCAHRPFLDS